MDVKKTAGAKTNLHGIEFTFLLVIVICLLNISIRSQFFDLTVCALSLIFNSVLSFT